MTILQFQELYYIAKTKDFDFDKSVKMVGVVTGLTPDQVDGLPMARFNKICADITRHFNILEQNLTTSSPVEIIHAKGRTYRIHYRVDKLPVTAGSYVDVIKFGEDVVTNLHKIMASICEPVKWSWKKMKFIPYKREHADIAEDMEKVDFKAAYHAAVFFYTLYTASMQLIRPYLVKELTAKGIAKEQAEATLNDLSNILDGFTMPNWSQNLRLYLSNRFGVSA